MGAEPVEYVVFGVDEHGNFIAQMVPDDEMKVRALIHKGSFEIDRYYREKVNRIVKLNGRVR